MDIETAWHEIALKIARPLRRDSKVEQRDRMLAWLKLAELQRDCIVNARRVVAERNRAARNRGLEVCPAARLQDLTLGVALNVMLRVTKKNSPDDLSSIESSDVVAAVSDAFTAMVEYGRDGGCYDGIDVVVTAVAATSALGRALGVSIPATVGAAAMCGDGKTNAPRHIFALTLAELGHTITEIQRAGADGLHDPAHIRRLTRAVRVS